MTDITILTNVGTLVANEGGVISILGFGIVIAWVAITLALSRALTSEVTTMITVAGMFNIAMGITIQLQALWAVGLIMMIFGILPMAISTIRKSTAE